MQLAIRHDDPMRAEVATLIEAHLDTMALHSPPGSIHALDTASLTAPDITFWTVWADSVLVGCGALREIDPLHGEIKSMHTARTHRGQGVGTRMLVHLLDEARRRSYHRVSLETGSMAGFAPARALYRRFGFAQCPPFADYCVDPNSVCMTLDLTAESP